MKELDNSGCDIESMDDMMCIDWKSGVGKLTSKQRNLLAKKLTEWSQKGD